MANPIREHRLIDLDTEHSKSLSAAYRVSNDASRKAAFRALAEIQDLQQRGKTSPESLLAMHRQLRTACHTSNCQTNLRSHRRAATLAVLTVLVLAVPSQAGKLADGGYTGLDSPSASGRVEHGLVAAFGGRRHAQFRTLPPCTPATPALCHEAFATVQVD